MAKQLPAELIQEESVAAWHGNAKLFGIYHALILAKNVKLGLRCMKNICFSPTGKWCNGMFSTNKYEASLEQENAFSASSYWYPYFFMAFILAGLFILPHSFAEAALVSDRNGRLYSSTRPVRVAPVPQSTASSETQNVNISSKSTRTYPAKTLPAYTQKRVSTQKPLSSNVGLEGFSPNPFGLERDALGQRTPEAKKLRTKVTPMQRNATAAHSKKEEQVSVTSKINSPPGNRLIPHRAAFSGGIHTLPHMENETNPEVSMSYKMSPKAATRLVVNPQDPASPLYRPAEKDGKINGGGVYMDVNLREDLQLQMGGEYNEIDNQHASGTDSGASLGLRWSF